MSRKVLAVCCVLFTLIAIGAADPAWEIVDTTFAPMNASDPATGVLFMTVQDISSGNAIDPGDKGCTQINTKYKYNTTGNQDMSYIEGSSGRYYATFPTSAENQSVRMQAWGTGCNQGDANLAANATVSFNSSRNQTVDILNGSRNGQLLEGEMYTFAANVTEDINGSLEDEASVNWTLYDYMGDPASAVPYNTGPTAFDSSAGMYHNDSIPMPTSGDHRYYLMFESANHGLNYTSPSGADAQAIWVNESMEATLTVRNNNSMCDTTTNPSTCQEGAVLETTFNVTADAAENVTGWINGDENLTNLTFTAVGPSVWQNNHTLEEPLNTTTYGTAFNITVVANNSLDRLEKQHTFDVDPFTVVAPGIGDKPQGGKARLRFRQEYPYDGVETLAPIPRSETDMFWVGLYHGNGTMIQNETIGNGSSIGSSYEDDGGSLGDESFVYTWNIPSDADTGSYYMELNVTDIYGIEKNVLHPPGGGATRTQLSFGVYNSSESSNVEIHDSGLPGTDDDNNEANETYSTPRNVSGGIVLKNQGERAADLVQVYFSNNLTDISNYSIDGANLPATISTSSNLVVDIQIHLRELNNYTGDITFEISGDGGRVYNRSLSVDYTVQKDCSVRNDTFCAFDDSIDMSYSNIGDQQRNITVGNLKNTTRNISTTVEGNISRFLSDQTINLTAYQEEDIVFDYTLDGDDEGNWSGTVVLNDTENTIEMPANITVSIPEGNLTLTVNGSTDLGSVRGDASRAVTFVLENNGTVTLEDMSLSVSQLGTTINLQDGSNPVSIDPGESYTTAQNLSFGSLSPGTYDSLTVLGRSSSGVEDGVELSITVEEDLSTTIDDLQSDLESMRSRLDANSAELPAGTLDALRNRLDELQSTISEAETANQEGNYAQAENRITEAQNTRDTVQGRIDSQIERLTDTNDTSTGGNNQNNTGNRTDTGDGNGNGGGLNPLLIIIPLLIIVVVGVILYLSIVPEEESPGPDNVPDYTQPPDY